MRPRDAWIGWGRVLHDQRLHPIANNTRFSVLPAARLPNLASRALALNLRRLSGDWQQIHGYPLLLAETFVDFARFTGARYRAANWQVVGSTRGFARRNGHYFAHGQPKQVLLYPLHRQARALLCAPTLPPRLEHAHATRHPDHRPVGGAATAPARPARLPPPRGQRHRLATVLTMAIAAVLAGSRGSAPSPSGPRA